MSKRRVAGLERDIIARVEGKEMSDGIPRQTPRLLTEPSELAKITASIGEGKCVLSSVCSSTTRALAMKLLRVFTLVAFCLGLALSLQAADKVAAEKEKAPRFKLKASDGKEYDLSSYAGKQAVVIAWFPKAFTNGCRAECLSMRDAGEQIRKYDVAYFTASCDDLETQKKWAKELELDYPVLSDPDSSVAKAYGVVHEGRERPERWTFVIDKEGVVQKIDKDVKTKSHGEDIAKTLEQLGVAKKK